MAVKKTLLTAKASHDGTFGWITVVGQYDDRTSAEEFAQKTLGPRSRQELMSIATGMLCETSVELERSRGFGKVSFAPFVEFPQESRADRRYERSWCRNAEPFVYEGDAKSMREWLKWRGEADDVEALTLEDLEQYVRIHREAQAGEERAEAIMSESFEIVSERSYAGLLERAKTLRGIMSMTDDELKNYIHRTGMYDREVLRNTPLENLRRLAASCAGVGE